MSNPRGFAEIVSDAVSAIQNVNNRPITQHTVHTDIRSIFAYWVLGLCNNFGFVVMLSAAYDIITRFNGSSDDQYGDPLTLATSRDCSLMSTGVLLLADTIPSLSVSLIAPFMPFYINLRILLAALFSASGFIIVASAQHKSQAFLGVIFTSISSGLGETSMLAYTAKFNRNVISAWASGTGAAGVTGALAYAALTLCGITSEITLLIMLIVPVVQLFTFCFILREPSRFEPSLSTATSTTSLIDHSTVERDTSLVQSSLTFSQKVQYLPKMLKYVLPLFAVYLSEYFINQGLLDLIYYPNIRLDHPDQYRWLQVTYQIGVFISRSSLSVFSTDQIWIMSLLQFVNVVFFIFQAIYMFVPLVWFIFAIVLWEGLLGGFCYANTFNRIAKELPIDYKSFGMGITTIGQSCGVVLAGLLAIPIHREICKLPAPNILW